MSRDLEALAKERYVSPLEFARLENQGFDWAMDHASLVRFVANLVYYGAFVPAAYGLFFRSAASSTSSQTAR